MQVHDKLFIGGEWVEPAGTGAIDVISPHTEEVVARVPDGTAEDMDRAVAAARRTFDETDWSTMPVAGAPRHRAAVLRPLRRRA